MEVVEEVEVLLVCVGFVDKCGYYFVYLLGG